MPERKIVNLEQTINVVLGRANVYASNEHFKHVEKIEKIALDLHGRNIDGLEELVEIVFLTSNELLVSGKYEEDFKLDLASYLVFCHPYGEDKISTDANKLRQAMIAFEIDFFKMTANKITREQVSSLIKNTFH